MKFLRWIRGLFVTRRRRQITAVNCAVRWCFTCQQLHYMPGYFTAEDYAWMKRHCPKDVAREGCSKWFFKEKVHG